MKTFLFLHSLIFALALTSSASPPAATDAEIIGTWRWVSVDGQRVPAPFYTRYYANGKMATWPAPKGWGVSHWFGPQGVSRGPFSITSGFLVLGPGSGADNPKSRIKIQKDQMTLTTDEGHRLIYRRIVPTIEPGKLEDGSPAGFSKM